MKNTARLAVRGVGLATVATLALTLTACGSDSDSGSDSAGSAGGAKGGQAAVDAALTKGGTITVWAWEPTLTPVVKDFEAKYPNVKIKLVNAGTGNDQYKALQNAISAGKGVPDIAQIEYYAMGQFSLSKSVADLSQFGAADLEKTYSTGPWNAVKAGNGVYALPMDSGPMALYYNKRIFDKYHIAVPTTWDEYVTAGEKLHKADPKEYITNDTGDAGFATSMIWQAGGRPYTVDGTNVGINFSDAGSQTFASTWQKLISGKLVAPITSWSDEWYKGLADGTIATLATGAWMPANLISGAAAGSGDWRVAPLPQWKAGAAVSSENGGSALAVPEKSANKALAYAFVKYADDGPGVQTRLKNGGFPSTTAELNSPAFLATKFPYFGGQTANTIFSKSASEVPGDWKYLPFQVYSNSIFNDTVGKAYASGSTLKQGLASWQAASVKYGKDQGFSVK
jgi:multiple sugar transport system substrate-binding protein